MKKILSGMTAAVIAFCSAVSVFAAPQYSNRGSLLIESDIKSDTNTKRATVRGSVKADISKLFIWTAVNSSRTSEKKFVITSETGRVEEGTEHPYIPVDIRLRITNPDAKKKSKYIAGETETKTDDTDSEKVSVFEYYMLTVSDDEDVIFTAEDIPADTTEIEIPLRLFNCQEEDSKSGRNYSDEGRYTVSLRESTGIDKSSVTEYAAPTKWKWYVDATQLSYMVDGKPTPTPKATPTPKPTPTPTPKVTEDNKTQGDETSGAERKDVKLKEGDYIVGKDIAAGRYYVVGSGMLKTYDAEGNLTGNVDLSAAADTKGYYSLNLKNDESVSLSEPAEFKISAPSDNGEPEATPATRTTPTPKVRASSTPRVRNTPTPTPKSKASSSKTTPKPGSTPKPNPKTGDAAPILSLTVLGLISLSAVAVIQIKKKMN